MSDSNLDKIRKHVARQLVDAGVATTNERWRVLIHTIAPGNMEHYCLRAKAALDIEYDDLPEVMAYHKRTASVHVSMLTSLVKFMHLQSNSVIGKEIRRLLEERKDQEQQVYIQAPPTGLGTEGFIGLDFRFQECKMLGSDKVTHQVIITDTGPDGHECTVVWPMGSVEVQRLEYPTMLDFVQRIATLDEWSGANVYVATSAGHVPIYGPIAEPIFVESNC